MWIRNDYLCYANCRKKAWICVIKGNDGIEGGFEDGFEDGNEDGIKGQTSLKVV